MTQVDQRSVHGSRIEVTGLGRTVGRGESVLSDVSFVIEPAELVAIVGGSGSGKTTLLEAMAGIRPASAGSVRYDGVDLGDHLDTLRSSLGYVPQDDIIHRELPLATTLRYAARLRIRGLTGTDLDARVVATLATLDLTHREHVRVGDLSGGQRRRASIAVELLTDPRVFLLDEPTSGLDPAMQADVMRVLHRLTSAGCTVVLTTHAPENLRDCDKILFLARGGRLAFFGTPRDALQHFDVSHLSDVYELLAEDLMIEQTPPSLAAVVPGLERADRRTPTEARRRVGAVRQWRTLTRRNLETIVRNRLTLAILLGSPVMVVVMLAVLFRPGAFRGPAANPPAAVQMTYWIAFGGFFFGVTYGLLQIVSEFSIFHRERLAHLSIGAYVLSKLAVLVPFLALVDVAMLGVLRLFNRLPALAAATYVSLGTTIMMVALAALAIGLLASALVTEAPQATLALPVICWPQVLFAGALVPVSAMTVAGRAISYPMAVRWGFEGLGHDLRLNGALPRYEATFSHTALLDWAILATFTVAGLAATCLTLARRTNSR